MTTWCDAKTAMQVVESGNRVFLQGMCSTPTPLIEALVARGEELRDVELLTAQPFGPVPYTDPRWVGHFHTCTPFVGESERAAVNAGRASYAPVFFSSIPTLFASEGPWRIDVAFIQVSSPDKHGYCSLGPCVDVTRAAVDDARQVVALVNPQVPRTHGDSYVHVSRLDYAVQWDGPLYEVGQARLTETQREIGRYVGNLIEDGATLQLGIGAIPDAVLQTLTDRRDLGVHSDMFADGVLDLVERGVITGARKSRDRGKMVASFVIGSRRLMDFLDDNPMVELRPISYTNNIEVIGSMRSSVREEVTDMQEIPEAYVGEERPVTASGITSPVTGILPRVVVIGAGFGGLQAARALGNVPVQVTVIDRNNHHLFQPLLYQVATAGISPADICSPIRHVLKKQHNTEVLMGEVTGVDVQEQRVFMGDQAVPYDYLILATGARDSYFGHPDWANFAPGLKSIRQATEIRNQILWAFEQAEKESDEEKRRALLTFVLVGAGPTGVEMAGSVAGLAHKTLTAEFHHINPADARIILVEALPRILLTFPERLANKAKKALNHLGVEVRTNSPVEDVNSEGVVIGGKLLPTKTVIWTAGVAASPAGAWLGTETDRAGRVKVNSDISVPGHPNIFVLGDTAQFIQDENGKPLPGLAQVAIQQGRYVAGVIADRVAGKEHGEAFHYVDKGNMATIGGFYAIASIGKLQFSGRLAWFMWLVLHLFFLIGFRNRVVVLFQWIVYYTTYRRGARVITSEKLVESQ